MLELKYDYHSIEAGCDEAGRGCLAGPVFAAAVILPDNFSDELLNDSKQLSEKQRAGLRPVIEREALAWAVASVDNHEIDKINILNGSREGNGGRGKNHARRHTRGREPLRQQEPRTHHCRR